MGQFRQAYFEEDFHLVTGVFAGTLLAGTGGLFFRKLFFIKKKKIPAMIIKIRAIIILIMLCISHKIGGILLALKKIFFC